MPELAEQVCIDENGNINIIFESSATKFIQNSITPMEDVITVSFDKLINQDDMTTVKKVIPSSSHFLEEHLKKMIDNDENLKRRIINKERETSVF